MILAVRLTPRGGRDALDGVRVDDAAFVDPDDDDQLISNLVWASGSRGGRDVWVAGEPVLADGAPARVDPGAVLAGARRVAARVRT